MHFSQKGFSANFINIHLPVHFISCTLFISFSCVLNQGVLFSVDVCSAFFGENVGRQAINLFCDKMSHKINDTESDESSQLNDFVLSFFAAFFSLFCMAFV